MVAIGAAEAVGGAAAGNPNACLAVMGFLAGLGGSRVLSMKFELLDGARFRWLGLACGFPPGRCPLAVMSCDRDFRCGPGVDSADRTLGGVGIGGAVSSRSPAKVGTDFDDR